MATSGKESESANTMTVDIENFNCPICLEVYHKPRRIACGHVFCKSCLAKYEDILSPACPVCRQLFDIPTSKKARDIIKTMKTSSVLCLPCGQMIPLLKLRCHHSTCLNLTDKTKASAQSLEKEEDDSLKYNRYTFRCPYCGLQNLDTHTLVKHCNESHWNHPGKVVCPICSAMPWGNSKQKSSNFLAHLNMRHQFEYEFVVDFDLDDEQALKKAIEASLVDQ